METLQSQRRRASLPLMWLGIGSIIMAFAGLTSGYVVSRTSLVEASEWLSFSLPSAFRVSTAIILVSSLSYYLAKKSIASGNSRRMIQLLVLTFVLGAAFIFLQVEAWNQLIESNIYFAGKGSNPAGSWVYAISLFHVTHVLGGLIALIITIFRALRGRYTAENHHGIKLMGMYWHFVDLLWLYLYVFLSVIR